MAAPLDEPFLLRQTNVSLPTLQHAASTRSVAASEDYYSIHSSSSSYSDEGNGRSRSETRPTAARYQTAPSSRYHTPMHSRERGLRELRQPSAERQTTAMRGTGRRRSADTNLPFPNPLRSNPRTSPIRRTVPSTVFEGGSPVSDRSVSGGTKIAESSAAKEIAREAGPPTPGVDDTPNIHFALDQITRDEETGGSRAYPPQQEPIQTWRVQPTQVSYEPAFNLPLEPETKKEVIAPIPPRHPRHSYDPQSRNRSPVLPDMLVAFEPTEESLYPPLGFTPAVLRPLGLGLFAALLTLYLVALLFTAIWSRIHDGLWYYSTFGDGRYFLFQYLPTLLGMILLLWLFEIEIALFRLAPFIALASDSPKSRSHAALLPLCPSGFMRPTFAHFKAGKPVIGVFLVASWLNIFTIPLLSTTFNVYFRGTPGRWVWLATQGVVWVVIVLYILLLAATITLIAYLHRRQTGLKWDPDSMADLIVILEHSNLLDIYAAHTDSASVATFKEQVAARNDRLGYWHSSLRTNEVYHTLGAPDLPRRQYSRENELNLEKMPSPPRQSEQFAVDPESGRPYSFHTISSLMRKSSRSPTQTATKDHLPWFLRPSLTLLWTLIAIVLLVAFLVVSYLPSTAVQTGFLPDLPVPVNSFGFSSDNFLYSFIPSLLGLLCLLFWYSFDLSLRRLQPYASLSDPTGALAEHSLLLSYPADGLGLVSLKASANGHIRIALISMTTLIAATLPILGGGVFWAQFYIPQQRVRISAHMPAFYALTVLLALYALAYLLLPLTPHTARKFALPAGNRGTTLLDAIALLHQSRLLSDTAFRAPASKTALVTRMLSAQRGDERLSQIGGGTGLEGAAGAAGSKTSLADSLRGLGRARLQAGQASNTVETPRYALGSYVGRDGGAHVGIDRVGRTGVREMVVRGS